MVNCETLGWCLITVFEYGIRSGGGLGDVLNVVDTRSYLYWGRFFYDITFWMIIVIILLKIIFGIILDTFGSLRDAKDAIDLDIRENCFICSLNSDLFQRQSLGFKHHSDHEHNTWHYLYFLIYLKKKSADEFSALEEYVDRQSSLEEIEWFPVGRSIALEAYKDQQAAKNKKNKKDKGKKAKEEKKEGKKEEN